MGAAFFVVGLIPTAAGIYSLALAFTGSGGIAAALGHLIAGLILLAVGSLCCYPVIADFFSCRFVSLIYGDLDRGPAVPRDYSRPRALIAAERFPEAEEDLRRLLDQDPDDTEARLLLAELLADRMSRVEDGLTEACRGLAAPDWTPAKARLLFLALDTYQERGEFTSALQLLDRVEGQVPEGPGRSAVLARKEFLLSVRDRC
jgi:tetratricopeptide (TPR) repeat protein